MDPEVLKKALEAIEKGDAAAALQLLKDAIATAATGGAAPSSGEAMSEVAATPPEKPEDKEQIAATLSAAREELTKLSATVRDIKASRDAEDLKVRREMVGALVQLGVEFPHTAWKGDPTKRDPADRLMLEDLDGLRARVELLSKSRAPLGAPRAPETVVQLSAADQATADKLRKSKGDDVADRFVSLRTRHARVS